MEKINFNLIVFRYTVNITVNIVEKIILKALFFRHTKV